MRPRLTLVTLGVKDFKQSLDFYKNGLGWPTSATEKDDVAFFQLSGTILSLYPRHLLAEDATVDPEGSGFPGITMAHNVESEKEVEEVLEEAQKAGAKIVKKAQKASWGGYTGYFADPNGYLWEVAYNPHWRFDENGNAVLP